MGSLQGTDSDCLWSALVSCPSVCNSFAPSFVKLARLLLHSGAGTRRASNGPAPELSHSVCRSCIMLFENLPTARPDLCRLFLTSCSTPCACLPSSSALLHLTRSGLLNEFTTPVLDMLQHCSRLSAPVLQKIAFVIAKLSHRDEALTSAALIYVQKNVLDTSPLHSPTAAVSLCFRIRHGTRILKPMPVNFDRDLVSLWQLICCALVGYRMSTGEIS